MNCTDTVRVLLLEDDPDDYRLIARQLRAQQPVFVIDWAESLSEAIEKLGRNSYDIVLTDLSLADSVGLQTVAVLRNQCCRTPIIALTSLDDEDLEKDILEAGAQDYLIKGEMQGRAVTRAILHAVQRQQTFNEVGALVAELEQSQQLLRQQAQLLRKKNRRLRQLYKTAQEFVDNVSHDFRTPLTVIKDYVTIIREGMVGDINEEQQNMLDKVAVRADDLDNMVDDLLDVSKLEAGLLGAWRRNVHIADVIERVESLLQQRAHVKQIELTVECEPDLPEVYCDADKVGRVITNLAINAIKFSGNQGRVQLWVRSDPAHHQVIVGITDNGPGIDKEALGKIFQKFRQINSHVKSTVKGFGLGLNIAQQLCKLNLGKLTVQSQVGQGSTFSFSIPIADPKEVLRRWLSLQGRKADSLRLVEIHIAEDTSVVSADEFDCFLNCLLRTDDLLFRCERRRWLLVLAVSPSESAIWFQRTETEYRRCNRNRPMGPLPCYEARTAMEWQASDGIERVLCQFETFAGSEPVGELVGKGDE